MPAVSGWLLAGVRTPFARAGGPFRHVPSYELGRVAAAEAIARAELDPARLDEVIFGHCGMPAEAANSSRIVALRAGVPERVPAFTVHRNCASGMEAVASALYRIAAGDASLVLAGGMENMTQIPLQYSVEYARLLHQTHRDAAARAELETAVSLPPTSDALDARYQAEARDLLGKLGR